MNQQREFCDIADEITSIITTKIQPHLEKVVATNKALAEVGIDDIRKGATEHLKVLRKQVELGRGRNDDLMIIAGAIDRIKMLLGELANANRCFKLSNDGLLKWMQEEITVYQNAINDLKAQPCRKYTSAVADKAADPLLSGGNLIEAVRRGLIIQFRPRGATATDLNAAVSDAIMHHRTDI